MSANYKQMVRRQMSKRRTKLQKVGFVNSLHICIFVINHFTVNNNVNKGSITQQNPVTSATNSTVARSLLTVVEDNVKMKPDMYGVSLWQGDRVIHALGSVANHYTWKI